MCLGGRENSVKKTFIWGLNADVDYIYRLFTIFPSYFDPECGNINHFCKII